MKLKIIFKSNVFMMFMTLLIAPATLQAGSTDLEGMLKFVERPLAFEVGQSEYQEILDSKNLSSAQITVKKQISELRRNTAHFLQDSHFENAITPEDIISFQKDLLTSKALTEEKSWVLGQIILELASGAFAAEKCRLFRKAVIAWDAISIINHLARDTYYERDEYGNSDTRNAIDMDEANLSLSYWKASIDNGHICSIEFKDTKNLRHLTSNRLSSDISTYDNRTFRIITPKDSKGINVIYNPDKISDSHGRLDRLAEGALALQTMHVERIKKSLVEGGASEILAAFGFTGEGKGSDSIPDAPQLPTTSFADLQVLSEFLQNPLAVEIGQSEYLEIMTAKKLAQSQKIVSDQMIELRKSGSQFLETSRFERSPGDEELFGFQNQLAQSQKVSNERKLALGQVFFELATEAFANKKCRTFRKALIAWDIVSTISPKDVYGNYGFRTRNVFDVDGAKLMMVFWKVNLDKNHVCKVELTDAAESFKRLVLSDRGPKESVSLSSTAFSPYNYEGFNSKAEAYNVSLSDKNDYWSPTLLKRLKGGALSLQDQISRWVSISLGK